MAKETIQFIRIFITTFLLFANAIRNVIIAERKHGFVLIALRNISLSAATGSMLLLERAMLGTFGNPESAKTRIMESWTGAGIFVLLLFFWYGHTVLYPFQEHAAHTGILKVGRIVRDGIALIIHRDLCLDTNNIRAEPVTDQVVHNAVMCIKGGAVEPGFSAKLHHCDGMRRLIVHKGNKRLFYSSFRFDNSCFPQIHDASGITDKCRKLFVVSYLNRRYTDK